MMHTTLLTLLMFQGLMGAWDTLWHHEMRSALPQQISAREELKIHSMRALLYGVVFVGLALFVWGGATLLLLWGIILIEVLLTLWDFVIEDRTRLLPPSERIIHTLLAINGGALFGLLAWLSVTEWMRLPTSLIYLPQGWLSIVLVIMGIGVALSGIRDALAWRAQGKRPPMPHCAFTPPQTAPRSEHFLITGGTGFIGQELVRALLADGQRVTLWCRNPLKAAYQFQGRAACVTRLEELPPHHRIDVVINLAGEPIINATWNDKRKQTLLASRVSTTQALVQWLEHCQHKPRLMLSASAIGYYGTQTTATAVDETAPAGQDFAAHLCAEWEKSAHQASKTGIPLSIIRLGIVLGYQGMLPPLLLSASLGMGARLGDGQQILPWVHIADVIRAIAWCCQRTNVDTDVHTYNLVAPETTTQDRFNQTCATVCRRPAWMTVPAPLLRTLLGERADMLLRGIAVTPAHLQQQGFTFLHPELRGALAHLTQRDIT